MGVFIGIGAVDYSKVPLSLGDYYGQIDAYSGTGNALSIAANRLSYAFDWRGPSMSIDTACSSSLVAVHAAVRHLHLREANLAVAGGVNLILSPEAMIAFSDARMLSADGHCRPFDARANGYVRGEGAGLVVLKRLSDAVADRDRILAVIRGSAVNQDGRTSGLTAPNSDSQRAVIRAALTTADLRPGEISYVEAHGTGTPLGDPIEWESLRQVFSPGESQEPCLLSSVKANIGHLETAAGIASLLKVVLMMRRGVYVPQADFSDLNPHISAMGERLRISRTLAPWTPRSGVRRAGVSSFGFGGTNAHLILEEGMSSAPASVDNPRGPATGIRSPGPGSASPGSIDGSAGADHDHVGLADRGQRLHLLTLSARSESSLRARAEQLTRFLRDHPDTDAEALCHTANVGRQHFSHRLALTAESVDTFRHALEGVASSGGPIGHRHGHRRPRVAFLFTGQGGQYPGMGRLLLMEQPRFRETFQHCDEILRESLGESILEIIHDRTTPERVSQTRFTQPALFALEYSLGVLWRSWGIEPCGMLGHSVGEYVAATLAGVMSLEDGLRLIARRGALMQRCPPGGAMAAVFAAGDRVGALLDRGCESGVSIAAYNGSSDTVISGPGDQVDRCLERFAADGIAAKRLTVSHAFHSALMDRVLDEFGEFAATITMRPPQVPLVSNLTGKPMESAPDAEYWCAHLRHAVRFEEGLRELVTLGPDAVVEVGPAAHLSALAKRSVPGDGIVWLPSMKRNHDDTKVLLETLGRLYERGCEVRWEATSGVVPPFRISLPTYPFERKRHWYPSSGRSETGPPRATDTTAHPLVGGEVMTATADRIFESRLDGQRPPWLAEHRVQGSAVVPAAAYLEQALGVADELFGPGRHRVVRLSILQAMFLEPEQARRVQCVVAESPNDQRQLRVLSRDAAAADGPWTLHAVVTVARGPEGSSSPEAPEPEREEMAAIEPVPRPPESEPVEVMTGEAFYEAMRRRGLEYGESFRVLEEVHRGPGLASARVAIGDELRRQSGSYHIHPALLDGCLQAIAGVVPGSLGGTASGRLYLPTATGEVRRFGDPCRARSIVADRCQTAPDLTDETVESDVRLLDGEGQLLVELRRVRLQALGAGENVGGAAEEDRLYEIVWQPAELDRSATAPPESEFDPSTGNAWLIFAPGPPGDPSLQIARRLVRELRRRGRRCAFAAGGEMFAAEDALSYRIDVDEPADHRRLLDAVYPAAASGCAGIVCIAPASPEPGSPEPGSPESGSPESGPPELGSPEPGSDQPTVTDRSRLWKPALLLLQQVLRTRFAASPAIWLCSHGAQPVDAAASADPWQALLWGLGRTVALESAGEVRLVDLDPTAPPEASAENLADEMTMPSGEAQVVRRGGSRFVARLRARGGAEPGAGTAASGAATIPTVPFRLQFGETGSFDELRFVSCDLPVLAPDQVQLRIAAAGLNFSDVLKAMGLYPGVTERHPPLGIECAGTVTQVGERVDRFVVGDRVTGVAPYTFASHTVTADYTLVPIPLGLGFEEASTIPIVFLTAHYALRSLGRLQPKEKVLIHAGAGGVGLAAIQVARAVGAEIFATAGSDAKRDYLRGLGVPHVFNSRTTEFAGAIMEFTEGRGVDVVLNSLPGEAIHESLKILGPFGRFLEIGKTDIYQDQMIGLAPFRDNLSYFAIDLDRMLRQRPAEISRLFGEVMESFSSGAYGPLPYRKFPAEEVAAAFRHMAQRKNIGKVVVELAPDGVSGDEAEVTGGARRGVRADATYLIVGGLGALGMRLAEWLIESGARSIVLMARRAPSSEQQARFSRFPADVRVVCVRADVADAASLRDGLAQIPADRPPLAGVIHAAGGLADGLLYDMDPADFEAVLKAKVDGGWNLHKASADWHLDFFLLFSSVASILGSPGQGNYAAANAFLDSLAAYRRARGLPATVINWGPWADGGMAADQQHEAELEQRGMRLLRPDECLAITDRLLRDPEALQTVVADIDWPVLSRQFPAGPPPLLEGFADRWEPVLPGGGPPRADRAFFRQWRQADETGRQELLEDYLISELSRVLATSPADLEKDQPLSLIGVDSLMAMELKTNLESRLSVEIPLAALMDGPTLSSLVDDLLPLVARSVGAAQAADTASTAHESASVSGHDWAGGSLNGSVDGAADASLDSSLDNSLDGSGDGSGDGAAGGSVDGAAGGSADGAGGWLSRRRGGWLG